jgi:hypothetical protein
MSLELERQFFGVHAAQEDQDAAQTPRARSLPKHRARRRPHWKPASEPVQPQHAHDGDALLR